MNGAPEVLVRDEGALRHVVLDRVERRNALSLNVCVELSSALISANSSTTLVVIDHKGDTFSSGADLSEIAPALLGDARRPSSARTLVALRGLLDTIENLRVPVVAAIHGRCLAGGLELALACDLIAATPSATFFDAHLAAGLLPSGGAGIRLPDRVGLGLAFRLLVEGVRLDAAAAYRAALVDAVFEDESDLLSWASSVAARLAAYPDGLVAAMKRQLNRGRSPRSGRQFAEELDDIDEYLRTHRDVVAGRLARFVRSEP